MLNAYLLRYIIEDYRSIVQDEITLRVETDLDFVELVNKYAAKGCFHTLSQGNQTPAVQILMWRGDESTLKGIKNFYKVKAESKFLEKVLDWAKRGLFSVERAVDDC